MNAPPPTAIERGFVSCEVCRLLSRPADIREPGNCPRCGAELALRRRGAIQRTWAFIIAAAICYVPANLMPMMETTTPTYISKATIIDGIVLLYNEGSWPLALIMLIASVVIPLAKISALAYLLVTVHAGSKRARIERTQLYRLIAFVGRWSMLDVLVVTFVVSLVRLKPLMSVAPEPGVLFFGAVVVLTMLASESFDPRLIWDAGHKEAPHAR